MLKRTVTYTDPFEGTEVTEDLWFNMTKAEVAEMAMIKGESWVKSLEHLSAAKDAETIMREFKFLIGTSYGERVGNKHIKSPEITQAFMSSEAYSTLFLELIASADSGADFFAAILPKDLDKLAAGLPGSQSHTDLSDKRPAFIRENREPTQAELQKMTKAELAEAFRVREHTKQ